MSEILKCVNLTKKYGGIVAIDNINLSIESGKIIGLLGPNGSGKTTLIKLINGLLTPNSGEIYVNNMKISPQTKKLVAYLPDNNFLNSYMTAEQIITMFTDFFDDFRPNIAYEMLSRLGVMKNMRLKNLSKGNKEKVCLILTMSRNAMLYVLDEPIAAVDPATRDYIISTILNNYNTIKAIQDGNFKVPELKKLPEKGEAFEDFVNSVTSDKDDLPF